VRAARIYRKLADEGWGMAAFDLATMYQRGEGVRRSWPRAIKLYREATGCDLATAKKVIESYGA